MRNLQTPINVAVEVEDDLMALLAAVRQFSSRNNLAPLVASSLMTIASELGTNLVKYARCGVVTGGFVDAAQENLFIEALDQGPGIEDIEVALQDHFSTGGSMGMGLPGVRRLSSRFEIESTRGKGTRVRCELKR